MKLRSFATTLLCTLLFAAPVFAGSFYLNDAAGLTGPVVCDEQMHEAVWINTTGSTRRFTSTVSWIGIDIKGVGDTWFFAHRLSDGAPMTFISWDHYANPTTLHQFRDVFQPTFNVPHGDGISILYFCQVRNKHMHVIIKAQYE